MGAPFSVVIDDPERMNLLGLLLAGLLERRLADPAAVRRASRIHGPIVIDAQGMVAVVSFEEGRVRVSRSVPEYIAARLSGTLSALLGAALGRDTIKNLLRRNLTFGGNPFALLHLLSVMKA